MKRIVIIILISCMFVFQYCSSSKKTASTPAPKAVTYTSDIQPLVVANCSPCHIPPRGNKKALNTYDAAKANIDDMIRRISLNPADKAFMPFKHAKLSDSVIHVFVKWKEAGLAEK